VHSFIFVLSLLALALPYGCQQPRHEACNPADSAALCTQVQKCFASDASTEACREHEQDALQVAKPNPRPMDDGASKALMH
jgi:hypothetical protein